MSLPKTFTEHILINESFLLSVVIIFFIAFFLKEHIDGNESTKKVRKKIHHFANVYFWNLVFSVTMALFLVSFIALNCNNHRVYEETYSGKMYESTQQYKIVNSSLNLLSVLLISPFIVSIGFINIFAFSTQTKILKQYNSKIIRLIYKQIERLNVKNKIYVAIFIANLFMSFSLLSSFFFIDLQYKPFIYLLTSMPFALFVVIYRPYTCLIDNLSICFGQITSIIFISGLCVK